MGGLEDYVKRGGKYARIARRIIKNRGEKKFRGFGNHDLLRALVLNKPNNKLDIVWRGLHELHTTYQRVNRDIPYGHQVPLYITIPLISIETRWGMDEKKYLSYTGKKRAKVIFDISQHAPRRENCYGVRVNGNGLRYRSAS